jgi:hypothetical protein
MPADKLPIAGNDAAQILRPGRSRPLLTTTWPIFFCRSYHIVKQEVCCHHRPYVPSGQEATHPRCGCEGYGSGDSPPGQQIDAMDLVDRLHDVETVCVFGSSESWGP